MAELRELVFGTKNQGKIDQLQGALASSNIHIIGINEVGDVPTVDEDGATLIENAIKKATTYAMTIGRQVLSMDNGLYLEGLSVSEQPGIHVRRINGIDRATDEELLSSYIDLISKHGGKMQGRFAYAVVLAQPDGKFESMEIDDERIFVSTPSDQRLEGYPLESLCIDPVTNTYVAAMSDIERAAFWQRVIGEPMAAFVGANLQ